MRSRREHLTMSPFEVAVAGAAADAKAEATRVERLSLVASILSTVNVQTIHTTEENESVAKRAVLLADAVLRELGK